MGHRGVHASPWKSLRTRSPSITRRRGQFAAGAFTNLTPEHLDYHGDLEAYFESKALLFEPGRVGFAAVNGDDPWGRKLVGRLVEHGTRVEVFSSTDAAGLSLSPSASTFEWEGVEVTLRLGGRFNVTNALAAATVARGLGISPRIVAVGLSGVEGVAGRFESVDAGQPFTVLVDYSHTPDGLAQALVAAGAHRRAAYRGRFGAGGDRDQDKRPVMGEVATRLADIAVFTSDNPRSEDPDAIIEAVRPGAAPGRGLVVEPDRARAIATRSRHARPGDVVLIAGKGHERARRSAAGSVPFDDAAVARPPARSCVVEAGLDDRASPIGRLALILAMIGTPLLIHWLRARGIGQQIREDGPERPPLQGRHADHGRPGHHRRRRRRLPGGPRRGDLH